ncbi:MAG: DUF4126 domain-containing protein [Gammaproteobacteria bacterium]|nr:MAG: DUF4126 domain-containing protein [Gammaproteobacteria bacterium]
MDIASTIALTLGVAWASGINLYAAVFMLGFLGNTGHIELPPDLQIVQDPAVLMAAGFMYCVEFFADKAPGVDSGWDAIHSFIRIPAGATLAAMAVGDVSEAAQVAAFLVGGAVTTTTHATKAGSRVLINTSPEPFSNWVASVAEDIIVIGGIWAALQHPVLFLVLLGVFVVLMIWLLPKIWRGMKFIFRKLGALFGRPGETDESSQATTQPTPPDPEKINTSALGAPPKNSSS